MMNVKANKVISKLLLLAVLLSTATILYNYCSCPAIAETQQQFTPVQGKVVYVPSGTTFPATATMELSSESLLLGQSVCIALSNDFYYNNTLIAPLGSSVNGTVIHVRKAGKDGANGQLSVKFTNIVTPYGQMIPISAKIQTDDGTGIIKSESKTDSNKDMAIGTAAGAVAGIMLGPLSDNGLADAAAYGAVAGVGANIANSICEKGTPAKIPAGSVINIILDQQITFTPQQR